MEILNTNMTNNALPKKNARGGDQQYPIVGSTLRGIRTHQDTFVHNFGKCDQF